MVGTCLITAAFGAAAVIFLLPLTGSRVTANAFDGPQGDGKPSNGYGGTIPPLDLVREITASTASADFADNAVAYAAASEWYSNQLQFMGVDTKASYLACAEYNRGQEAVASLRDYYSASAIQPVINTKERGSCFLVAASAQDAIGMLTDPGRFNLVSVGPLVPTLKIAPGMLEHQTLSAETTTDRSDPTFDVPATRLRTTHGERMKLSNVCGLSVRLAPSVLPVHDESAARTTLHHWLAELMSDDFDMFSTTFWSDPGAPGGPSGHVADHEEGVIRIREWTRAAEVVHTLAEEYGKSPGDVCKLGRTALRHVDDDLLVVEGVNHLLPGKNTSEAQVACFMALVSHIAARPEVLRVAPLHSTEFLNAVAKAVVQSATIVETPLHDAGLIGTGEVIQVIDSGLDETSCFFADEDGVQVEHGHIFEGILVDDDGNFSAALRDPSFHFDMSRRKVVQYIELFRVPGEEDEGTQEDDNLFYFTDFIDGVFEGYGSGYDSSYTTTTTGRFAEGEICEGFASYSPSTDTESIPSSSSFTSGFNMDAVEGHGTWVAGIAAGSVSPGSPYLTQDCSGTDELPSCAGGCLEASEVDSMIDNGIFDIDLFCPMYDCDDYGAAFSYSYCFGDDPLKTLVQHSGVAPGAKISLLDCSYNDDFSCFAIFAGNMAWESSNVVGAMIHSNSWGAESFCQHLEFEFSYDSYMYENPESLLIFGAGNNGGYKDIPTRDSCTVLSPALGKNILSVGATSSGPQAATTTGADGRLMYDSIGITNYSSEGYPWICWAPTLGSPSNSTEPADIDIIASFSSYGPTLDGRIKPEIVAPGDQIFSASSDGTDDDTCELVAKSGTSGSTPIVAGATTLVRQYFRDYSFYAKDVNTRGLCNANTDSFFQCKAFTPSSATIKAMLINSANLMGGGREPDNSRGFGRVHLEAGMPMSGEGDLSLLVADSSSVSIKAFGSNALKLFVDGDAGLELRATLSWLDPPSTTLSAQHLQHDLDLVLTAPSGVNYTMWESGEVDTINVIERVIVPTMSVEDGAWTITVCAGGLLTGDQPYSLVVTGAILGYEENV